MLLLEDVPLNAKMSRIHSLPNEEVACQPLGKGHLESHMTARQQAAISGPHIRWRQTSALTSRNDSVNLEDVLRCPRTQSGFHSSQEF